MRGISSYESVTRKCNLEDRWSMHYGHVLKALKASLTRMSPSLYMHHFMGNIL